MSEACAKLKQQHRNERKTMRTIIVLAALWLLATITTLIFDVLFANEIIGAITFIGFVMTGYVYLVKLVK